MNRKMLLPIIALAAIIPAIGMMSYSEESMTIQNGDKFIQITTTDEIQRTLPDRVLASDLVIQGKILSIHPKAQLVDPEHKTPWLFTVANVQIEEILKGETNKKVIQVQLFGGETEDRKTFSERLEIKESDSVVMFLGQDSESIFGENYGLIGSTSGMYVIEDDVAEHYVKEKSLPIDSLKIAIEMTNQQ